MNTFLWVLQGVLAVFFLIHGAMYLFPPEPMREEFATRGFTSAFRIFIGLVEWLAAVGLTLPSILSIQPDLIIWAAAGVVLLTLAAATYHLQEGEASYALLPVIICLVAIFLGYARWQITPL